MDAGRWVAAERGAFEESEAVQPEPLPTFPLAARLTEVELVMIWQFREGLRP